MSIRTKNCGLVYLRMSSSPQETSLEKQLNWATAAAEREGVRLGASLDDIATMQAGKLHRHQSIRLDSAISGSDLQRPGLAALVEDAQRDPQISHIFVYKRDRLGRPDSPVELMSIEDALLRKGITLIRSDGTSIPQESGESNIAELAGSLFDYWKSGRDLRELAEQMIRTQLQLATKGFWSGGTPPYGFSRALVNSAGEILEILPPGKRVRQQGCHTLIVPGDEQKLGIWIEILQLKEQGWSYKRIARHLNEHGHPSPAAGTTRTDHGITHEVSGKWSLTTVRSLCQNRTIIGMLDYGRRSEGKFRRFGPEGPRFLADSDGHADGTHKRVINDASLVVSAMLPHEPHFDAQRWEGIQQQIAERGKCQHGIPKTRDPARYPLSCRVIDLTDDCGSLMYARTSGKRRLYVCGSYMKTGGAECENNSVDAEAMLKFTLGTLVETVDRLGAHDKLKQKLIERAKRGQGAEAPDRAKDLEGSLRRQIAELEKQLATAQRNLAIEELPELREAVREEFQRINNELKTVRSQLEKVQQTRPRHSTRSMEQEVDAAMGLFDQIRQVADDEKARAAVAPLLDRLGLHVGLRFVEAIKGKQRRVRRLASGVIGFGNTLRPGPSDQGCGQPDHTHPSGPNGNGRQTKQKQSKTASTDPHRSTEADDPLKCHPKGISFTKVSRDDRI